MQQRPSTRIISIRTNGNDVIDKMWSMRPINAETVPAVPNVDRARTPDGAFPDQVHIVSGESGSGKTTWALMTSDLGIYLTPDDFGAGELNHISATYGQTPPAASQALQKRNDCVVDALFIAAQRVLGVFLAASMPVKEPVSISLVLDEFGGESVLVRGLCAVKLETIHSKLSPLFGFAVNLKVIVVGTGTDMKTKGVGSH
ncbi:Hypothetical protein, putative, partial [Bodo saltans]